LDEQLEKMKKNRERIENEEQAAIMMQIESEYDKEHVKVIE
jgi:hypothetical protein